MKNSVIVPFSVTFLRVFLDSLAGYSLARLRFRGRAAAFATIVTVMAVPGVVLLIPKFLIIRQLGIYDTYYGMIVPLLVDAAGVFIMKNFFESIPISVEESLGSTGRACSASTGRSCCRWHVPPSSRSSSCRSRDPGTSCRTSSSRRRARASTR